MNSGVTNCSYYMQGEKGEKASVMWKSRFFSSGTKTANKTFLLLVPHKESTVAVVFYDLFKSHDHKQRKSISLKKFISKGELSLEML